MLRSALESFLIARQVNDLGRISSTAILTGFVAVLFSEIVSAKCKNALSGVVLVIDSAAELDVDVAINGQFCPTSPQISVRLTESLKRSVVQHTYQIMFHDHFVRLIIFVGIHVAKLMTGRPSASYGKHGNLQNPFHQTDKPNPSSLPTTIESLRLLRKKKFSPKNSDFALRFAPRLSNRNWSSAARLCPLASQDRARIVF